MRWLKSLRYSGIGVFVASVIGFIQGCSVKEGAGAAAVVALLGLASCNADITTIYVVDWDNNNFGRASIDGTSSTNFGDLNRLNDPLDIAIAGGRAYITNFGNNRVIVSSLGGNFIDDLGNLGGVLFRPRGIAIDELNGFMYVAGGDVGTSYLVRATLDGTLINNFGDFGGLLQVGQRIALTGDKIYVTSGATDVVIMVNADGSDAKELALNGLLNRPRGIAIDHLNGKMYVVNESVNGVIVANLDGTNAINIGNPGGLLDEPFDIALDLKKGKMYIASAGNNRIVVANLDGSGAVNLGHLGFLDEPRALALK